MAYLGFVLRRRHGPNPAKAFQLVAELFETLLIGATTVARRNPSHSDGCELGADDG